MTRETYGTAEPEAPITRTEFERAVRSLNASDLLLRDTVLQLAARVVSLTDELVRRIDRVEPLPAPPSTPARQPTTTVEGAVEEAMDHALAQIRAADVAPRVQLDANGANKYETPSPDVPCEELIPLCGARCCTLSFPLSTADLDEGVVRWDYGQPYLIAQRASDGYCVHNAPDSRGCTVHPVRPRICRAYDCRDDKRIWRDYATRTPATDEDRATIANNLDTQVSGFDLLERAKRRTVVVDIETRAISETPAYRAPRVGPPPRR